MTNAMASEMTMVMTTKTMVAVDQRPSVLAESSTSDVKLKLNLGTKCLSFCISKPLARSYAPKLNRRLVLLAQRLSVVPIRDVKSVQTRLCDEALVEPRSAEHGVGNDCRHLEGRWTENNQLTLYVFEAQDCFDLLRRPVRRVVVNT